MQFIININTPQKNMIVLKIFIQLFVHFSLQIYILICIPTLDIVYDLKWKEAQVFFFPFYYLPWCENGV